MRKIKRLASNIWTGIFLVLSLIVPGEAQILTVDPEAEQLPVYKPMHLGTTLSGTTGLISIPTPDIQEDRTTILTYKGGITKRDLTFNRTRYRLSKNEHFTGLAYQAKPNLELTVLNLRYERSADPYLAGLSYYEDSTTFGMKYSTHNAEQDMCMGFSFAPMDAYELNRADLSQIENLRHAYLTVSEKLAKALYGYLNLKYCFTDKQKIDLGLGQIMTLEPKQFLISGIGLEYAWKDSVSLFCEGKFANYRDLYMEDSTRASFNAGVRFGSRNAQIEVLGLSLEKDPYTHIGANVGF
jgi:hypothetical protein